MLKKICKKTRTKDYLQSKIKLNVLQWIQCYYKFKLKLKLKQKLKLHVEMTVVADAAVANLHHHHHHQEHFTLVHLQFQFQIFQVHQDVHLDNTWVMVHAHGILYQILWNQIVHQDSTLMDMETVFQPQQLIQLQAH